MDAPYLLSGMESAPLLDAIAPSLFDLIAGQIVLGVSAAVVAAAVLVFVLIRRGRRK